MLKDEGVTYEIKLALGERAKSGFLTATNVMDVVSSPEVQAQFVWASIYKPSILKHTMRCWLGKLGWQYGRHQNGMYIDGHKCEDVVEYRKGFVD